MSSDRGENTPITEENNANSKSNYNIDSSTFMLEEHKTIAAAFFDTRARESQMFKFYITLVTIPITLIAAIFGIENVNILPLPFFVAIFMIVISIAGYLMTLIIINMRFESILYARTINLTRRFFRSLSNEDDLTDYLVLPTIAYVPNYFESPWSKEAVEVSATFIEVLLMGLLNSTYLGLGIKDSILTQFFRESQSFWVVVILWFGSFIFHILSYRYLAKKKQENFTRALETKEHHKDPKKIAVRAEP